MSEIILPLSSLPLPNHSSPDGTIIEIIAPDDLHHHFRDNDILSLTVPQVARLFSRVLAMPNLVPPVTTVEQAKAYKERIIQNSLKTVELTGNKSFSPLMTLYLTDNTTPEEIRKGKEEGIISAVKLYPANATTNSQFGITDMNKLDSVFETMSELQLPLLIHGEMVHESIDIFDREKEFIDQVLKPLLKKFPRLKVVLEHITTKDAVDFILEQEELNKNQQICATVTPHHLLFNRNAIFGHGINPHYYCLPILKKRFHQEALIQAVVLNKNTNFFLGSDSAPHLKCKKENSCGCAGIYNGHIIMESLIELFDSFGRLDNLETFTSINGAKFYQLEQNQNKIKFIKKSWKVPAYYFIGEGEEKNLDEETIRLNSIVPLKANEELLWQFLNENSEENSEENDKKKIKLNE